MTQRTVITLRARFLAGEPSLGELMASATGKSVYRILKVVRVSRGGASPSECRFRLVCVPVTAAELPPGATVHPWRWGRQPSPERRRALVESKPALTPPGRLRQSPNKRAARVPRVRTDWSGVDLGPSLRRRVIRDRAGRVLREADVELTAGPDPANPNRSIRRAHRVDPLDALLRTGALTDREADAAELVRFALERLGPSLAAGNMLGARSPSSSGSGVSDLQVRAASMVREAAAALGERLWRPVLWVCLGGSVSAFAVFARVRKATAGELVQAGFLRLADHCEGVRRPIAA